MEHQTILGMIGLGSKEDLYWISILLFVGTYAMIILEKFFHRVPAALLGGMLAVFLGVVTPESAWESIDHNTMFLLIGMMVIVSVLIESGFFSILSSVALKITKGDPFKIILTFTMLTAVLSAFLDNVTTVLFMIPILISITSKLKLKPIPYVIATVLASNIGGTATLIGDPPNIIIGSLGGFTFMDFIVNIAPIVVVTHIIGTIVFIAMMKFRGDLEPKITDQKEIMRIVEEQRVEYDVILMRKGLIVFGITILLFFLHHILHLEAGTIALFMASILMIWSRENPEKIFERVEWTTLMFFLGLFVVIGGLEHSGVFEDAAHLVAGVITDPISGILILGSLSAVISGIVDNIPFTMAMSYVLIDLGKTATFDVEPLWWALALGACLGGNLTIIGASANVVAAGLSEREGYPIKFFEFVKQGTPVTVVTVIVALGLLWLKYTIF
ncbi:possible tyrosine transporter P-protein [Persephonella hydrogeniphila]|uniref:Possible tyrosine transporter P-protein n=1 Tax=Persephonella hydrogeniphila TaxID=198703 RepID=A0A285NF93_9AQUI|nr:ArsB/NhaD family transporter [Persephonella hydrogeniphila]SNZ08172.1 possible tyrosine transporter P-protein [Persephonella hydrogeniphila]